MPVEISNIDPVAELTKIVKNSRNMVFFGGAGVSTESGIPDFRSTDGLYKAKNEYGHSPEDILSRDFLVRHTREFFCYYKNHVVCMDAKPNGAHKGLSRLEREGKLATVITQNIDGLHQAAGSQSVLELHGSIHRNTCLGCGRKFGLEYVCTSTDVIPCCDLCGGVVRPDVVLYNETLDDEILQASVDCLKEADTLIVGGTSLAVYPAAGLLQYFHGSKLVVINKTGTAIDTSANLVITDPIGEVFNKMMEDEEQNEAL